MGHAFFSFFAQLSLRISLSKTLIWRDIQAMSSSNPSSSHYYVAVPADGTKSTTSTSTATTAAASSSPATRVLRPKRRCFSLSRAFILLLLLGLLLFFLVPRRPIVRYQSSTLSLDESTSSVTLSQLFSYYNPNYYTVYVLCSLISAFRLYEVSQLCLNLERIFGDNKRYFFGVLSSLPYPLSGNGTTCTFRWKIKKVRHRLGMAGTMPLSPFGPFLPALRL